MAEGQEALEALLEVEDLRLTREKLSFGRRVLSLESISAVDAEHLRPDVRLPMAVLVLSGAIGLPGVMSRFGLPGQDGALLNGGLGVLALLMFLSIARLLAAKDRYAVVVAVGRERLRALISADHQLVIRVVAVVRDALPARAPGAASTEATQPDRPSAPGMAAAWPP